MNLPPITQKYIDASNAHDVKSILACFADDAIVRDENETRSGKSEIERWLTSTIEKYNFQFKPLSSQERDNETLVTVEIAGTFPGSPISLGLPLRDRKQQNRVSDDRFLMTCCVQLSAAAAMC